MDKNLADLRKSYERDALDEEASAANPLQQFEAWLQQALDAQLPEPNAMTLATVGAGDPTDCRQPWPPRGGVTTASACPSCWTAAPPAANPAHRG